MSFEFVIVRVAGLLDLVATHDQLQLRPIDIPSAPTAASDAAPLPLDSWPPALLRSSAGAALALDVEQILDRGLGTVEGDLVRIAWEDYERLADDGIALLDRFLDASPFLLAIDRESEIGRRDFTYLYQFLLGGRDATVERWGYVVRHRATERTFRLDPRTYRLVAAMDRYNALPDGARTQALAWEAFAAIREDAEQLGVPLDEHLASNRVIVPSQLALDFEYHPDGSLSFVPRCPELGGSEFATVFLRNTKAERVYALDGDDGRRIRILLDERQQAVLERMKRVSRVHGAERERAERTPEAYFDGVLGDIEIRYGPRVTGVGELTFTPMPSNPQSGGVLQRIREGLGEDAAGDGGDSVAGNAAARTGDGAAPEAGDTAPRGHARITVEEVGGRPVDLEFVSASALAAFREKVAAAVARDQATVEHDGRRVQVDAELLDELTRTRMRGAPPESRPPAGKKYLLIYTNEEELVADDVAAADAAARTAPEPPFTLPESLSESVTLKRHQLEGIRWLGRCAAMAPARRGALLADDMGLGKTLQILVHLARLIERGGIADRPDQGEAAPWRPILIVAPLMLVENETWLREMAARFRDDGEVFRPWLTLYGPNLAKVRAADLPRGKETDTGRPSLDADKLMRYRVVVTTYETVVNYQHSFAQLRDGRPLWSAIVTDEAQRFKMLNTKISVALKAIPTQFHIASTGTPVENRLLDLWNIVDTFQPALLGTASEFTRTYETPLRQHRGGTDPDAEAPPVLDQLRSRLHFGTPQAFLIRRSKDELTDLPEKRIERLRCDMSREEHEAHAACLGMLRDEGPPGRHLAVLQRLALLSQHPWLTSEGVPDVEVAALVGASAKLRVTLDALRAIRDRGEKAIIFARHVAAQNLLSRVIAAEFGVRVPIINGTTAGAPEGDRSSEATRRTREGRKRVLDTFRASSGFGVLVLSPFVAGVGLTITEANHVIHYGRWWNPAVEAQATDRAYRIGQTRPVTVYYPILRDPWAAEGSSFDEVLDALLARKLGLARDFLHPVADEDGAAGELRSELLGGRAGTSASASGTSGDASEPPLDGAGIDRLSASDFEACVAALLAAEGYRVVLTCASGDGGADVIAVGPKMCLAVQVKHARAGGQVGAEAVRDVLAGLDTYRGRLGGTWSGVVCTSGSGAPDARREATAVGVTLVDRAALVQRVAAARVTLREVLRTAERRAGTFEDGVRHARAAMDGVL